MTIPMTLAQFTERMTAPVRMSTAQTPVHIGAATLTMAEALDLKRRLVTARAENIRDQHFEDVVLWNAIQRADRIAKGLPHPRPLGFSTPLHRKLYGEAVARLERRLAPATVAA